MLYQLHAYHLRLSGKTVLLSKAGLFIFLLCCSISHICSGQNKKQLYNLSDTSIADRANRISAQNIFSQKDSAIFYANLAMDISKKLNYAHGIAEAFSLKCQIAKHFDDDFIASEKFGLESLNYFEKTRNKDGIDIVYYNLFNIAFSESKFEDAIEYSEKYYNAAILKNNLDEIYSSLTCMFSLNRQMGNYEKSFFYAKQLYDISVKASNKLWLTSSLWNLAQIYTSIGDYKTALGFYKRVNDLSDADVKTHRKNADKEIWFEMEFAEAFSKVNQFDSAWHYYQIFKTADETFNRAYLISTGECLFLQGYFLKALRNFQLALPHYIDHHESNEVTRSLLDIAKTFLVLDSLKDAIIYGQKALDSALQTKMNQNIRDGYKILSDAYDQLGNSDSSNFYFKKYATVRDVVLNNQTKGKFAAYNYEQRIDAMSKEKELQQIRLQKETIKKNVLIGGMIFLLLFAIIVFRNITINRKHEASLRVLAENNLRIQKLESEKSTAELLQQKSELEMKALRAQMNPHFIFNCLNSINQFIIVNDPEKASDYLTKFAKLIRMVLEKSGKSFIPLNEELNCLRLYMDLESIRFEKPFEYKINYNGIDTSSIMIPSLLMQPFVENAIWHGLHPNENNQGKIKIDLIQEANVLHCEISDNGIGLTMSELLKTNSMGKKKSLGIDLTKQRLHFADTLKQKEMHVHINDLIDETGKNTGTCVHIRIPIQII